MSRSVKKHPWAGICSCDSVKDFKRCRTGQERTHERELLVLAEQDEEAQFLLTDELVPWNEWNCPRDGKFHIPTADPDDELGLSKLLRK